MIESSFLLRTPKRSHIILPSIYFFVYLVSTFISPSYAFSEDAFSAKYKAYLGYAESGITCLKKRNYSQAIIKFSKVIEKSPFNASHYYNRGIAFYKYGKNKKAEKDFDRVIILNNRKTAAYVYRGLCREGLGKHKEAIADYQKALRLKPDDPAIHNNLAWIYATASSEKVRDKAQALEHAKKAVKLSKEKNAEILDTLAQAYFLNGKIGEAVEIEKRAIMLNPNTETFKKNLELYEQYRQ